MALSRICWYVADFCRHRTAVRSSDSLPSQGQLGKRSIKTSRASIAAPRPWQYWSGWRPEDLALQGRTAWALATSSGDRSLVLFFMESSAAKLAMALGAPWPLILSLLATSTGRARALALEPGRCCCSLHRVIAKLLDQAGVSEARGLQTSARERVYMWNFTADRILEKPLLGWGFDASREMPNLRGRSLRSAARKKQRQESPETPDATRHAAASWPTIPITPACRSSWNWGSWAA